MSHGTLRAAHWRAPSPPAIPLWMGTCLAGWLLLPHGAAGRSLVAAPLLEEIVFRWGVQDALSRSVHAGLATRAPLLAALLFAAAHVALTTDAGDAWRAAATLGPAWWIGLVYRRKGALAPCIAWHAAFNLAWLAGLRLA